MDHFSSVLREEDSRYKSMIKAISWRTAGTLATVTIVYIFTGKLELAAAVGGFEVVAKIGLYYIHERIWEKLL